MTTCMCTNDCAQLVELEFRLDYQSRHERQQQHIFCALGIDARQSGLKYSTALGSEEQRFRLYGL